MSPAKEFPNRLLDKELWARGFSRVAGVDEAGMGPLAGPVVAAAVILPPRFSVEGIQDSKLLSQRNRRELEREILRRATATSVVEIGPGEIDQLDIHRAGLEAMKRAVLGLTPSPDYLLVDARRIALDLPQQGPIKGDRLHLCIAAASILAKERRDRLMVDLDRQFPGYGFAKHKGYPTKAHFSALRSLGASPAHRVSWLAVREAAGLLSPQYYELLQNMEEASSQRELCELERRFAGPASPLHPDEAHRFRKLCRKRSKILPEGTSQAELFS